MTTAFAPTRLARNGLAGMAALVALVRLVAAVIAALAGDVAALTAFGFTVLLPLLLVARLLSLGPARTREGVLMRLGTAGQLVLVIAVPPFALHLALGLPVVFLLVELFETRLPPGLRDPIRARLVAC